MSRPVFSDERNFASLFLLGRVGQQMQRILQIGFKEIIHRLLLQTQRNPLYLIVDRLVEFGTNTGRFRPRYCGTDQQKFLRNESLLLS